MTVDDVIKRIGRRNWHTISDIWLEYISTMRFSFTSSIDETVFDESINVIISEIILSERSSTNKEHYYSLDGFHQFTFNQAVFLLYKGMNSLKAAQSDQKSGYKTWCISNYYESSLFFCKSILCLLGIVFYRSSNNKDIVIDLFPEYQKDRKHKGIVENRSAKIQLSKQFEHHDLWTIFKRCLNITGDINSSEERINELKSIDPKNYAKKRNQIIYHNCKWIFEDLREEIVDLEYGIAKVEDWVDDDSFPLLTAFKLADISKQMFRDIDSKSERFHLEYIKIEKAFEHSNNFQFQKYHELFR
jgi:hypothetical protein